MKIAQVLFDQPQQSFSDISGKNTTITKTGTFKATPPLTSRTKNSVLIEPSNSITISQLPIAKKTHEQEDFSISLYLKSGKAFSSIQSILYDSDNGIGLRTKDGNIVFSITDSSDVQHSLYYKLPKIGSKYNVVATYMEGLMSLIIDGVAQSQKQLEGSFEFKSSSSVSLLCDISSDYLLIDKVEIFNESLSSAYIASEMYLDSLYQNPGQIMSLDDAAYFSFSKNIKPIRTGFSYGSNKSLSTATIVGLKEISENYLTFSETSGPASGYFTDSVFITSLEDSNNNQISWYGDSEGISVSYNTDGGSVYAPLSNHSNVPGFSGGMFYYKVEMSSNEVSLDRPVFTGLDFIAYDSKEFRSDNTLYYVDTDFNYYTNEYSDSLINQSSNNGISTISGGVKIVDNTVSTVEFMFRPTGLGQTCLIDCGGSRYSWSGAGNITKTGIASIYINGVNLYSQTSISNVFIQDIWHHVVITLSQDEVDTLFINQSKTGSLIGSNNGIAHLGIYDYDMSAKAINHYRYLTSRVSEVTSSDSISIGSDSYSGYNVDKIVLSTQ